MTGQRQRISCLIPSAGSGDRLGLGCKGFLELAGRPLLCWVADKGRQLADEVVVAVPAARVEEAAMLLPDCRVIAGGETRHDSVALLAQAAQGDWLLLQDAARPFSSVALCAEVLAAARATGCAGAFVDPEVPVARLRDGRVEAVMLRDQAGVFQSPQAFSREAMRRMLEHAQARGSRPQSTLQLAIEAGIPVAAVAGEKHNIKLTTPMDWRVATLLEEYLR
jgi:2-C-methyl-D-erythritol 4-phosphate cytidylyltransferase